MDAPVKDILFFSTGNSEGGAERIAYNLCKGLHLQGYRSRMLARRIHYDADPLAKELVRPVPGSDQAFSMGTFLDTKFSTNYLFYLSSWRVASLEWVRSADVVHLHNMHGNYFNMLAIPRIMKRKPVVWTFHDMWPFTGKCVWSFDCSRYQDACGSCPQLSSYPVLRRDTTAFHLRLKKRLYSGKKFIIIAPSRWMQSQVERSILRDIPTVVIPSPYDSTKFFPEPKELARRRLGIPPGKRVILFVASWVHTIRHKGIETFMAMLGELYSRRDDLYTVVVGHLEGKPVLGNRYLGKETGWVADQDTLRRIFACADLYVSPTLADNSPCVVLEAMACGTVPIAYASGGIPEQILPDTTGVLVPVGSRRKLIEAVDALLNNPDRRADMERAAAERARRYYSVDHIVRQHLPVYEDAVKMRNGRS